MARQARLSSATGYYHVVMRGNNKDYIFKDKKDKEFFMEVLHGLKSEGMIDLVAWCLMDNHVHLALKAEIGDLALAMKRLNIRYAMRYHLKNKSVGHVFQDRFASEAIGSDSYLLNVIRYIHRNPVKAKMVGGCGDYRWSSYGVYMRALGGGSGSLVTGPAVHKGRDHQTLSPEMPSVPSKEMSKNQLIDVKGSLSFAVSLFRNKKAFVEFHLEEDYGDYLEVKEDRDKYRLQNAQELISNFCRKHGIVDGKSLRIQHELMTKLIAILEEQSHLSLRKIAKLLEMPYSSLQGYR